MSDEFPDEDPQAFEDEPVDEPEEFDEVDEPERDDIDAQAGDSEQPGDGQQVQTDEVDAPSDAPDERIEDVEEPAPIEQQPEPVDFEADQPVESDETSSADQETVEDEFEADDTDREIDPVESEQQPPENDTFDETGLDGDTSEAVVVPDSPLGDELDAMLNPPAPEPVDVDPLPEVGPAVEPAYVELWHDGEKRETFTLAFDELVIGLGADRAEEQQADEDTESAGPPAAPPDRPSDQQADADSDEQQDASPEADETAEETRDRQPDVDVGDYDIDDGIWRNHLALHRRNRHHYVYTLADATIQLNDTVLSLGDSRELTDGDIIVAGEKTALVFHTPSS
jgi:hypothetical protein